MPDILEQEETVFTPTGIPTRSRAVEFALAILGFVVVACGAYLLFAPDNWWLGDLGEAWHLGAFIVGGVLIMTGLGVYANETYLEDNHWTARAVIGMAVAVLALAGAVTAAALLIF